MTSLNAAHLAELKASAISDDQIASRGYQSIVNRRACPVAFRDFQKRPGLLMPVRDANGVEATYQLKPDEPRVDPDTGRPIKYETAKDGRICLDIPEASRPHLRNPEVPITITEGIKKVDSAVSHGLPCVIGVMGVDMWGAGGTALPDWKEIELKGRRVNIAYDSDVMRKEGPRKAIESLGRYLGFRQADVRYVLMPDLPDGSKCGLDDWFAHGGTVLELEKLTVDALPGTEMDWETPTDLDPLTGPPVPVENLSGIIRSICLEVAEEMQVPVDLVLSVAFGAISTAVGGKFAVRIPTANWHEPVHAMLLSVMGPGNRKSSVFSRLMKPVGEVEARLQEAAGPKLQEWHSRQRALEARLASAEKSEGKVDKNGKITNTEAVRRSALNDLEEHAKSRPVFPDIFSDDATPEAVKQHLIEQNGAYAVASAESAFLSNVAGRYSDAPHLDTILNGHPGDEIKMSRKGKQTERVARACLTLSLCVQPSVIESLGKIAGFRERGAAARFLPTFPEDTIGNRRIQTQSVSASTSYEWSSTIERLMQIPRGSDPYLIELDHDALALFDDFRRWLEPRIKAEGVDMQGWLSKLPGSVLRIAGLIHVTEHDLPASVPISVRTINDAIALGQYYHQHARIMFRMMYGRNGQSEAASILEVLRTVEDDSITTRNLWQRVKNRAGFERDHMTEALSVLEEHGWVRRERQSKGTGRPSEVIYLNPAIKSQKSQKDGGMGFPSAFETFETQTATWESPHNVRDFYRSEDLDPTGTEGLDLLPGEVVI